MVISICPECRRKLMEQYDLIETPYGKEFFGVCHFCVPPRETMLRQYDAERKRWRRRQTNGRRAQYREPFREEVETLGG